MVDVIKNKWYIILLLFNNQDEHRCLDKNPAEGRAVLMQAIRPNFEKRRGLVVVVAQDIDSIETLTTGNAVYFSTSRNERWMKGETSGDTQKVARVLVDCDGDAVIYLVRQEGCGACHTKARSCFYRAAVGNVQIMDAPEAGGKEKLPLIEVEVHRGIE